MKISDGLKRVYSQLSRGGNVTVEKVMGITPFPQVIEVGCLGTTPDKKWHAWQESPVCHPAAVRDKDIIAMVTFNSVPILVIKSGPTENDKAKYQYHGSILIMKT